MGKVCVSTPLPRSKGQVHRERRSDHLQLRALEESNPVHLSWFHFFSRIQTKSIFLHFQIRAYCLGDGHSSFDLPALPAVRNLVDLFVGFVSKGVQEWRTEPEAPWPRMFAGLRDTLGSNKDQCDTFAEVRVPEASARDLVDRAVERAGLGEEGERENGAMVGGVSLVCPDVYVLEYLCDPGGGSQVCKKGMGGEGVWRGLRSPKPRSIVVAFFMARLVAIPHPFRVSCSKDQGVFDRII